jgi:HNH endonuclease
VTRTEKQALRERFQFACGYCGVTEASVGAELTLDHFQPRVAGGAESVENYVYACAACNSFKSDWWSTVGPNLLHPLRDSLPEHIQETTEGVLESITDQGQIFIDLLHLNRPELVLHRRNKNYMEQLEAQVHILEQEVRSMATRLNALEKELSL